ncbi:MAG: flagellar hook-basal body complex protein, partial [Syntrophomonas sp.]|nr:flagellar hook-basal body complex protein [Syntrophomonas sp.]
MMRSMYSGVSGLRNHQTRMDVIGNNIANINTAGFKKSRVVFKDTLYQTMRGASGAAEGGVRGGINPMAVGLGMALSSIDQIHTEAPTTNTNKMTDLAIDGDGYFILGNGSERFYTRAGAFEFDGNKTLVSSANGFNVQGWLADKANDYAIADPGKPPTAINLSDYNSIGGRATSEMSFAGNLNAGIDFDAGMDEQQTIKFNTIANGGTVGGFFRLNFDGQNTAWIQVGANSAATAANMQKALEGLTNIGKGNVEVSWDNALQKYDVKFTGELAKTDVAKLVFLPGPAIKFDGGIDTNTVEGGSQHTSLAFADFPEGGVAGSYFQLSVGSLNTGLIQVGADSTATAANIRNALMAIGKPATATWDNANERYNIDFTTDPAAATTFTPIT